MSQGKSNPFKNKETPWRDGDRLHEMRSSEGQKMEEIADELGCCTATVKKWLDKYGIKK